MLKEWLQSLMLRKDIELTVFNSMDLGSNSMLWAFISPTNCMILQLYVCPLFKSFCLCNNVTVDQRVTHPVPSRTRTCEVKYAFIV